MPNTEYNGIAPANSHLVQEYARLMQYSCRNVEVETARTLTQIYSDSSCKEEKEVWLMPRKYSKLKEWSISARSLKNTIDRAIDGHFVDNYKFNVNYNYNLNIASVWNSKTKNVICTIKLLDDKIFIRYRPKSVYAIIMSDYHKKVINGLKIVSIPSNNLRRNKYGTYNSRASSKEAQLSFRTYMYKINTNKKIKSVECIDGYINYEDRRSLCQMLSSDGEL